jgi:hypothetical protein
MPKLMPVIGALTALVLTAALSGCGGARVVPVNGQTTTGGHAQIRAQRVSLSAPYLSANFESGTLAGWSSTAAARVTSVAAAHGTFGAQVSASQRPGYLSWSPTMVVQGLTYASLRAYVQVVSHGAGQSLDLITIKNSHLLNNFDFFVTPNTQRFKWDLNSGNTGQSAFRVAPGRWYLVEVQCEFAMITSPGQLPATVRAVWFGTNLSKTHVQNYDDLALRLGDWWPGYLGGVTG